MVDLSGWYEALGLCPSCSGPQSSLVSPIIVIFVNFLSFAVFCRFVVLFELPVCSVQ